MFRPCLQSESAPLCIASTRTTVLRRGDIEAISEGERDAARVIVLHLAYHHAITIECETIDGTIEKVIT